MTRLLMLLGMVIAVAVGSVSADTKISIPVSKATTYIDDPPLHDDGTVDYVTFLNREFGRGVMPDDNAATVLIALMTDLKSEDRLRLANKIGVDPAKRPALVKPISLVLLEDYLKRHASADKLKPIKIPPSKDELQFIQDLADQGLLQGNEFQEMIDSHTRITNLAEKEAEANMKSAISRPWSDKEFPLIAGWLKANQATLKLVHEAAGRPRFFMPHVSDEPQPTVLSCVIPSYPMARDGEMILAETMRLAGNGHTDAALRNLIGLHRLGRFLIDDPRLLSWLIGYRFHKYATHAELKLLPHLSKQQIKNHLAELNKLPLAGRPTTMIFERVSTLGSVMYLARESDKVFDDKFKGLIIKQNDRDRIDFDWGVVLRDVNKLYDLMESIFQAKDKKSFNEAVDAFTNHFEKLDDEHKAWREAGRFKGMLKRLGGGKPVHWKDVREKITKAVTAQLIMTTTPTIGPILRAADKIQIKQGLTRLAFALTAYKADHAAYPDRLNQLTPTYLKSIPTQPLNQFNWHFQRNEQQCELYSIRPGGKKTRTEDDKDAFTWRSE